MKISAYNFLFHSFHQDHSAKIKAFSVITNIALSILTGGFYAALFILVHMAERLITVSATNHPTPVVRVNLAQRLNNRREEQIIVATERENESGFVGHDALKKKMKNHLVKLQKLAEADQWMHLQTHTSHQDSGFDWWMFPVDRPSQGQGTKYMVNQKDVEELLSDDEFVKAYRQGVILVAKSWGFDLENKLDVTSNHQKWVGYQVRLGKMLHSLKLFNQKDLFDNLVYFIEEKNIKSGLEQWIKNIIDTKG